MDIKKHMTVQTIGHDKLNQLRHSRVFRNLEDVKEHMKVHQSILQPKFQLLYRVFDKELSEVEGVHWTKPNGGYFVSLNVLDGCAKKTVKLAKEAGVTLTKAGATYPYGIDPNDSNIRIAPSLPPVEELEQAMEVLCVCLKLAALEKLLDT